MDPICFRGKISFRPVQNARDERFLKGLSLTLRSRVLNAFHGACIRYGSDPRRPAFYQHGFHGGGISPYIFHPSLGRTLGKFQ